MIGLKTLKDLDIEELETYNHDKAVKISDLRAEAVKWVKFFDNPSSWIEFRKLMKSKEIYNQFHTLPFGEFFKHFFNLTSEDLK